MRYLANYDQDTLCMPGYLNTSLRQSKSDYEVLVMLEGKRSKADIVKYLLEKCRKSNFAPSIQKDGKQVILAKPSEQEAYFSSMLDELIEILRLNYMFERI